MKTNQKGLAPLFILIVLGLLVILASGASYYLLKAGGREILPLGKKDSVDLDAVQKEFDETDLGDLDSDFSTIDESASEL